MHSTTTKINSFVDFSVFMAEHPWLNSNIFKNFLQSLLSWNFYLSQGEIVVILVNLKHENFLLVNAFQGN